MIPTTILHSFYLFIYLFIYLLIDVHTEYAVPRLVMRIAKAIAQTGGFLLVNPTENLPALSPELREQIMMVGKVHHP